MNLRDPIQEILGIIGLLFTFIGLLFISIIVLLSLGGCETIFDEDPSSTLPSCCRKQTLDKTIEEKDVP